MAKVAKLVYVTLLTRVVVDTSASEDELLNIAKNKLIDKIKYELNENVEKIIDDTECPYGTLDVERQGFIKLKDNSIITIEMEDVTNYNKPRDGFVLVPFYGWVKKADLHFSKEDAEENEPATWLI